MLEIPTEAKFPILLFGARFGPLLRTVFAVLGIESFKRSVSTL
jgi:hypothetical protein